MSLGVDLSAIGKKIEKAGGIVVYTYRR